MDLWKKLGFSDGEGRVYEAILHTENATLQSIQEATGIERRNVYDIINKLISKGLVAYLTENWHKIYRVTDPKNIMAYFEEEQNEVEGKKAILEKELPALANAYRAAKPEFDVRIYRGKEGIKSLFNEMLDYSDIYFIGGNWGMVKYLGREWTNRWMERRIKNRAWMHDILTVEPKLIVKYPHPKQYYDVRTLPPEFGSPNVISIFGHRTANLFWGEPLLAIEIENPAVSKNYIKYFNYLWRSLKKERQ